MRLIVEQIRSNGKSNKRTLKTLAIRLISQIWCEKNTNVWSTFSVIFIQFLTNNIPSIWYLKAKTHVFFTLYFIKVSTNPHRVTFFVYWWKKNSTLNNISYAIANARPILIISMAIFYKNGAKWAKIYGNTLRIVNYAEIYRNSFRWFLNILCFEYLDCGHTNFVNLSHRAL